MSKLFINDMKFDVYMDHEPSHNICLIASFFSVVEARDYAQYGSSINFSYVVYEKGNGAIYAFRNREDCFSSVVAEKYHKLIGG